jgi:hypothetical protein
MAITQVRNVFNTAKYEAGMKKLDVRDMIFELQPDATPMFSVLGKMSKAKTVDTEFSWFEDDLLGTYTQINHAAYNAGETDLVVDTDTTGIFQVGDVLLVVSTGEKLLLTTINDSTHTLTVTRAWGTTTTTNIPDDSYIYKLGSSQMEGYTTPEGLVTAKSKKSNFVQIFSKAVEFTETANAVDVYGGNRRNFERNKKAVEMKRDIEAQFLWGEPKEDTGGTHPRRQTGGIYYFLSTVAPSLDMSSAALTESAFESLLKDVFTYSEKDRIMFTGPLINSQISQFASGKQRMEPGSTGKYGIKITTYHSANGDVDIAVDRTFIGPHSGKALIIEPSQMVYRYLQGFDFKLAMNVEPPNVHKSLDEYSATIGLEFHQAKLHGIIKNVV